MPFRGRAFAIPSVTIQFMRVVLTLDRDAGKREENDYLRSLLASGFQRDEIALLEPGSPPPEEFDGAVLGGGCDVDPRRYGRSPRRIGFVPRTHQPNRWAE